MTVIKQQLHVYFLGTRNKSVSRITDGLEYCVSGVRKLEQYVLVKYLKGKQTAMACITNIGYLLVAVKHGGVTALILTPILRSHCAEVSGKNLSDAFS